MASVLEHQSNATSEEETLLELLITLIEKYELEHEPEIPMSSGRSVLVHLMDAQDLEPSDLVEVLGTVEVVERILNGEIPIGFENRPIAFYRPIALIHRCHHRITICDLDRRRVSIHQRRDRSARGCISGCSG